MEGAVMRSLIFSKALATSLIAAAFAVGCATTGESPTVVKEDSGAAVRSQAYMQNISYVPMGSRLSESAACSVPSDIEKNFGKGVGGGPSKDWRTLLARANTCVNEKNWKMLEILANNMARIDMDSPWGVYYLSLSAEAVGEMQRSLWMIDQAQKKSGGKSALYRYQKGHVLLKMGETTKGMAEMQSAIGLDKRLIEAHMYLADTYYRDLDFSKAGTHYQAVLESDARSYRALVGLAEARLQSGATDEAIALYTRAQSTSPREIRPWLRLAYIHETIQKNQDLALSAYRNLKSTIDSGSKEKIDFDLVAKIKKLEESVKLSRVPAQASSKGVDAKRSVK
jgi:tetratricopeptide (TPR) repeat protein